MQKLKKHEPKISPNAALKFPFLHNVKHETSSGNDVAIAIVRFGYKNGCYTLDNVSKGGATA